MSLNKINIRNSILVLIIVVAGAMRLLGLGELTPWTNFTPIGAIALFGGAYFSNKFKAFAVPLITLFISDQVLNYMIFQKVVIFYGGFFWTYLSFVLMVLVGTYIKKVNVISISLASVVMVAIHWIVSDIGVVLGEGSMYPRTFAGYLEALVAAIPFERNFLYSTLVFSFAMFGGFEFAKTRFSSLQAVRQPELKHS